MLLDAQKTRRFLDSLLRVDSPDFECRCPRWYAASAFRRVSHPRGLPHLQSVAKGWYRAARWSNA